MSRCNGNEVPANSTRGFHKPDEDFFLLPLMITYSRCYRETDCPQNIPRTFRVRNNKMRIHSRGTKLIYLPFLKMSWNWKCKFLFSIDAVIPSSFYSRGEDALQRNRSWKCFQRRKTPTNAHRLVTERHRVRLHRDLTAIYCVWTR